MTPISLASLAKLSKRLGWEVRAWVLMDDHYHFALHAPEPNPVGGMSWLQNCYTGYSNTRPSGSGAGFGFRGFQDPGLATRSFACGGFCGAGELCLGGLGWQMSARARR